MVECSRRSRRNETRKAGRQPRRSHNPAMRKNHKPAPPPPSTPPDGATPLDEALPQLIKAGYVVRAGDRLFLSAKQQPSVAAIAWRTKLLTAANVAHFAQATKNVK